MSTPFYADWESADGLSSAEIKVTDIDGPYPAMVSFELDAGTSTLFAEDVEDLIAKLGAAASRAEFVNRKANAPSAGLSGSNT